MYINYKKLFFFFWIPATENALNNSALLCAATVIQKFKSQIFFKKALNIDCCVTLALLFFFFSER